MRAITRSVVPGLLAGAVAFPATLGGLSGSAQAANIAGPKRSALERLEEGDAIRRRLLLRGGRFELTPTLGFTMNDAFRRTALFGAQLNYHISDSVAIGVTALGGVSYNSSLADRITAERPEQVNQGAFSDLAMLGTAEFQYAPLIGKFAVFGRYVFNYDLHLIAGAGLGLRSGERDVGNATFTPVVGLGLRTFVNDSMAVTIQLRDYIYSSALNAVPRADGSEGVKSDDSWSNNFALTMGFGFYFPQAPKLSD